MKAVTNFLMLGGVNMNKDFPVANLSQNELSDLQHLEEQFRQKVGDNIILIAYEKERNER